jgi:hypothetical protein
MKDGKMENDPQAGFRQTFTPKLPQTKMKGNAGSLGKMNSYVSLTGSPQFAHAVLQAASATGLGLS